MRYLRRMLWVVMLMVVWSGCDEAPVDAPAAPTQPAPRANESVAPPDPTPQPVVAEPKQASTPAAGQPADFDEKLAEVVRLQESGETRSALILARLMQQQFASHPKLNQLIQLERRLNEQRDLEAELAVPLRNLGSNDPATVRVARQMLRRAGEPAQPLLRKLAHQEGAAGAKEARLLLADLGDPAALPMLLGRAGDGAGEESAEALRRFAAAAPPAAVATIYEAFVQTPTDALASALVTMYTVQAGREEAKFNTMAGDEQAYPTLRRYAEQRLNEDANHDLVLQAADALALATPGLRARFYEGINHDKLIADTLVDRPQVGSDELPVKRSNDMSARWTGLIRIDQPGEYTFLPTSDDGQRVIVNGQMIVDDWNMHGPEERSGKIKLAEGLHEFEAQWMQGGGGMEFTLRWQGPGIDRQEIPAERYRVTPWVGMKE